MWTKLVSIKCEQNVYPKSFEQKAWINSCEQKQWTKLSSKICELRFEQNYEQKCEHVFE